MEAVLRLPDAVDVTGLVLTKLDGTAKGGVIFAIARKLGLPIHVIHGNNTGDLYAMTRLAHKPDGVVRFHGMDAGIELAPGAQAKVTIPGLGTLLVGPTAQPYYGVFDAAGHFDVPIPPFSLSMPHLVH